MTSNAAEDSATTAGPTGGPGGALREGREAQNLSVADVARQLKLSVNQVEALEADDFERLPGAVFARGFVRNYARLLRLDAAPLLAAVARNLPREEPRPAAPPSREIPFPTVAPRRWPTYAVALAVVVALLAAYEFFPGGNPVAVTRPAATPPAPVRDSVVESHQQTGPQPPVEQVPPPQDTPSPGVAGPQADGRVAGSSEAQTGVGTAVAMTAATDASTADAKPGPGDAVSAPGAGERQIRLYFEQESWVEIRDRSGKPIYSGLNRPGTEQRVNGRPPLAIVVGNARGVRMTYDERPVSLLEHTKVDVARLTLE